MMQQLMSGLFAPGMRVGGPAPAMSFPPFPSFAPAPQLTVRSQHPSVLEGAAVLASLARVGGPASPATQPSSRT